MTTFQRAVAITVIIAILIVSDGSVRTGRHGHGHGALP
jgi:hypothetical protein